MSADVDVHWRHTHDARRYVRAASDCRAAGHDPNAVRHIEAAWRESLLVEEEEPRWRSLGDIGRHIDDLSDSESQQNALLHPRHRTPGTVLVALRGPERSRLEAANELIDDVERVVGHRRGARNGAQLGDPTRQRVTGRYLTHIRTPAFARADRTVALCFSSIGTSGSLSTFS